MSAPAPLTASVVVPSYNHAAYVEEAVASALDQDVLEVVVVDDGSSDDSVARLRAIADPRLRLITQENGGAHRALGRGIGLARGDVVLVLNSDDAFHPRRVERLLACFRTDPALVLAVSYLEVVDAGGARLGIKEAWRTMPPWPPRGAGPHLDADGDPLLALLQANYVATTSNLAFRRAAIERAGLAFLPLRYAHDWDFLLAAARLGGLALVEAPLLRYRVHGSNTIAEGRGRARGTMRFEALWVIARHAARIGRAACAEGGLAPHAFRRRLWRSLPPFTPDTLFAQLLLLRGEGQRAPAVYDALLAPADPFRRAAIAQLDAIPEPPA